MARDAQEQYERMQADAAEAQTRPTVVSPLIDTMAAQFNQLAADAEQAALQARARLEQRARVNVPVTRHTGRTGVVDDHLGQINVYTCPTCLGVIVTKDVDEGVTPAMVRCQATDHCQGMMNSAWYSAAVADGLTDADLTHVWKRARPKARYGPDTNDYISRGGLMLEPIARRSTLAPLRDKGRRP